MTPTSPPAGEVLIQFAERRIQHRNYGECPDGIEGHDSRDPKCKVCQALAALGGAAPAKEGDEWRCFHCNEVFLGREAAAIHFGTHESQTPACQIDVEAYRQMEAQQARYNEEDADVHRAMYRMQGEHQVALRRAEETGYARGLRDSGKCPCATPAAPKGGEGSELSDWPQFRERRIALFKLWSGVPLEEVEKARDAYLASEQPATPTAPKGGTGLPLDWDGPFQQMGSRAIADVVDSGSDKPADREPQGGNG